MMNTLDILIVEDDPGMVDLFETAIETWNDENAATEKCFTVLHADSIFKARKIRFDGALIDLRLPIEKDSGSEAQNGNEFAFATVNSRGIPVAIVSGHVAELSEELSRLQFLRTFSKNDGYKPAVDWLSEHWEMMYTLKEARNQIEVASAEVFAKRLWPQWATISALGTADNDKRAKIVTRQFASHIADLLGVESDENPDWHPFENYVIPSLILDRAHTGDLFRLENEIWVILSPQCDMANQNIPNAVLAKCSTGNVGWTQHIDLLKSDIEKPRAAKKITASKKLIGDFVNQNFSKSKHFLPPLPGDDDPVFVDFSNLCTRDLGELNGLLDHRIASISAPFLSNLVQRFGAFISRTGQPNIDIEHFYID